MVPTPHRKVRKQGKYLSPGFPVFLGVT